MGTWVMALGVPKRPCCGEWSFPAFFHGIQQLIPAHQWKLTGLLAFLLRLNALDHGNSALRRWLLFPMSLVAFVECICSTVHTLSCKLSWADYGRCRLTLLRLPRLRSGWYSSEMCSFCFL